MYKSVIDAVKASERGKSDKKRIRSYGYGEDR